MVPRESRAQYQPVPEDSLHLHYILLRRCSEYKIVHVRDHLVYVSLEALAADKETNPQSDFLSTNFPSFRDQNLAVRWIRRCGLLRRGYPLHYHFSMVSLTGHLGNGQLTESQVDQYTAFGTKPFLRIAFRVMTFSLSQAASMQSSMAWSLCW